MIKIIEWRHSYRKINLNINNLFENIILEINSDFGGMLVIFECGGSKNKFFKY